MALYIRNLSKIIGSNSVVAVSVRKYPRWSHRSPRRMLMPEEFEEMENKFLKESSTPNQNESQIIANDLNSDLYVKEKRQKMEWQTKVDEINTFKKAKLQTTSPVKKIATDMLDTVIDREGNFVYTKLAEKDSKIGSVLVNIKSSKWREKNDLVLMEGKRIIKDALESDCKLKYLIFSRKEEVEYLQPFLPKSGAKIYKMPYREMQIWSDLTTSPGVMGIFKVPNTEKIDPPEDHLPLTIICDNVREPGNLGAIIRCSAAVPCERIILTNGCVNLWDTKVTRSSAGSHLKLPILKKVDWSKIPELLHPSANIYIADNKKVFETNKPKKWNARDISVNPELIQLIESLPLLPYFSINFSRNRQNVLIIGGETEGISDEAYKFARFNDGVRVNIPLSANMDSLNTGTALGIIVFEMKRQMLSAVKSQVISNL